MDVMCVWFYAGFLFCGETVLRLLLLSVHAQVEVGLLQMETISCLILNTEAFTQGRRLT